MLWMVKYKTSWARQCQDKRFRQLFTRLALHKLHHFDTIWTDYTRNIFEQEGLNYHASLTWLLFYILRMGVVWYLVCYCNEYHLTHIQAYFCPQCFLQCCLHYSPVVTHWWQHLILNLILQLDTDVKTFKTIEAIHFHSFMSQDTIHPNWVTIL